MDRATREYINRLAEAVVKEYNINIPIVNIDDIVQRMNGEIEEMSEFDELCDGTIQKNGESGFIIAISPYQSTQRRNFTIAHELGHLFLHMGFRTNNEIWRKQDQCRYRRFGTSNQEYQANEFAAALLMPVTEYQEAIHEFTQDSYVDIAKVAERFYVSIPAATNRGRFLGILDD